jgi:hypothetical protein
VEVGGSPHPHYRLAGLLVDTDDEVSVAGEVEHDTFATGVVTTSERVPVAFEREGFEELSK